MECWNQLSAPRLSASPGPSVYIPLRLLPLTCLLLSRELELDPGREGAILPNCL